MRLMIIQPGIGPYRIDFFNQLTRFCELKVVYFFENATEQTFPEPLTNRLNCQFERVDGGFNLRTHYPVRPRLNRVIKEFEPDIVVGYEFNTLAMHLIVLKKIFMAKWKLFLWTSDNLAIAENCKFARRFFRYLCTKLSDGMLFYSDEVREYYVKNLVPSSKTMVLPNIQSEASIRNRIEDSRLLAEDFYKKYKLVNKKIFIFVGRLHPIKNLPGLLEAWKIFSEKFEDTKLIIIGSGSLENELKQQIATQNLEDSVIMTGACYSQDLWAWYYLADFLVLPSFSETFGAVVNEALTGGIPCLVSIKAGARVLIKSDKQGYLIDPDSIEDIREKMTKIYLSYSGRNKNERPESLMPWNLHSFVDRFIKFCKLSYN